MFWRIFSSTQLKPLYFASSIALGTLLACQQEKAVSAAMSSPEDPAFVPVTFADSVAAAHGFEHWNKIKEINFGFAVDVNDSNRVTRYWSWFPKKDSVVSHQGDLYTSYIRGRNKLDSIALEADKDFINDSYWVFMPFYLVWSKPGYESTVTYLSTTPISKQIGAKLTVQYRAEGGYTPGDAYDLYVDENYKLKEWAYRPGGSEETKMVMTWEDYVTKEGLVLPTNHNDLSRPVKIYHQNVMVKM